MELRHLKYLLAVAEEATFVRAAERLRVAQPALSRQIHDLEKEMGVELFVRGPRGARLTPAGQVCVSAAHYLLRQTSGAFERAREASKGIAGRCVICAGKHPIWSGFIGRIITRAASDYPHIELRVEEAEFDRQWTLLETFEADIGIGLAAPSERITLVSKTHTVNIFDSVLLSSSHPLADRESIALNELADHDLIAYDAAIAPELTRLRKTEFRRLAFVPRRERLLHSLQAVLSHVTAGLGWTFVPSGTTRMPVAGTVIVPLTDFKVPVPISIVTRRADHRPLVDRMIALINKVPALEPREDAITRQPVACVSEDPDATPEPSKRGEAPAIELRHLRYFAAVIEEHSIGRAAERLGLTQPALSRQIKDLEREVGVPLLERDARGVSPTLAGDSLYRDVGHILEEVAALPAEAQRARRGMISRCVLGIVATPLIQHVVNRVLVRILGESECDIQLEEIPSPRQPGALRDARIDIGLCHASPVSSTNDRDVRREYLLSDRLSCALLPADHPLASRTSIRLADLAEIPFIFISRAFQPAFYDLVYAAFADEEFVPRVEATHDLLSTIWALVAEGRGWGLGFESQREEPPSGLVVMPLDDFSLRWGVDLIHREDESRTSVLSVLDTIRDAARAERYRGSTPPRPTSPPRGSGRVRKL